MKWKKLGKIFDPRDHTLPNYCAEFSQSPQTVVFDDYVRVYFSTRRRDEVNGKFLSHIAFVDFDKDFKAKKRVSSQTVIELGKLGCFDEHGIFPINLLKEENRILAYTCGWSRRVSVSVETSTGLAVSYNGGVTFEKIGDGPVMSSSLNEPFLVGDSFVCYFNQQYHMWYIFGTRWIEHSKEEPARVYKIGHAVSNNGIDWERDGRAIISDRLNTDECQALPTVIFHSNRYHMYFCFREAFDFRLNKNRGYRIGYAYSHNLLTWTRDDANAGIDVSEEGEWDADMQCYPHVFHCNGKVYMLYNGNQFGRFGFGLAVLEE